jgi:hypothetical protein
VTAPEPAPDAAPSHLPTAATFVAIPLVGVAAGLLLAIVAAPGSEAAAVVAAITLPLAYGLSLMAWRAMLGVWLAALLGRSALRSRGDEQRFRDETIRSFAAIRAAGLGSLPFTWIFVPVGLATGFVAGSALIILSGGTQGSVAALLLLAATGQGIVLRRMARAGRLPLPDE